MYTLFFTLFTMNSLYLIEINDELKFISSHHQFVEMTHKKVYNNCETLWKIENIEEGLMYSIVPSLGESKFNFYSSLDEVNLEEFKLSIIDLNDSLKLVNRKRKNIEHLFTKERKFDPYMTRSLPQHLPKESFRVKFNEENNHKVFLLKPVLKEEKNHFDNVEKDKSVINVVSFKEKNKTFCNFSDEDCSDDEHQRMGITPSSEGSFFLYYNCYFDCVWLNNTKLKDEEQIFFPELKFLCQIKGEIEQILLLKNKMNETEFYNIDHVYSFLDYHCYEYQENSIENQVKNYIDRNFVLSEKIEHRIRFTVLLNNIKQNFDKKFHNNIKNILPKLLKGLGLNKKRYNDGMYWYGLKMRRVNELKVSVRDYNKVNKEEYNTFIEERDTPLPKNKQPLEKPISTKKLFEQGELNNYIEKRINLAT